MVKDFKPTIGKDVIESLTVGMYEDSRFIYREYIQNSADQIDKAVKEGLLAPGQGEIHINIDAEGRSITIEDNATGVKSELVQSVLQNIAQSTKQRGVDKGFRGIGRLGGLAYCQTLTFETSFAGEGIRSTLKWNAGELKRIINNRSSKEEAVSVIENVTSFETTDEAVGEHYFKVILSEVSTDELLNKEDIEGYLSMVAPLPFPTKFIFKNKVHEEFQTLGVNLDEYKIYLNTEQLFKGYSTYIKKDESSAPFDQVIDLVFFKEYATDGKLLYCGWHSISEKNQSMNEVNQARGFRLRKSNIQVGDEYTLLKLHRDRRFQFYFFGEVYGVHQDLIPNSRRDYFVENDALKEFDQKLSAYFHTSVHKLCYAASEINTFIRKSDELKSFGDEFKQKTSLGFTDKKEHDEYRQKFEQKKEEAIKAKRKLEKIELETPTDGLIPVKKILSRVVPAEMKSIIESIDLPKEDPKIKYRTDNLSSLSKEQRRFLGRIFSIIRGVLDSSTAENLIMKIEEELKNGRENK